MSADKCPFCRIVRGEAEADIVYRDDIVMAFRDIHPVAPTHILIIPLRHVESLNDMGAGDVGLLGRLMTVAREIISNGAAGSKDYRLVMNTGRQAGQSVFHLHLHLLAGRSMSWPPG